MNLQTTKKEKAYHDFVDESSEKNYIIQKVLPSQINFKYATKTKHE